MKKNSAIKNFTVFADLIKYRISLAVVLSSVTGYFICRSTIDTHLVFLGTGVFLLASGAAALNQYTERVADSIMERTRNRPIPSKKISEKNVLRISALLILSGCLLLYTNGIIPLLLGIFNVMLYNLLYTWLKKTTILSIIPGAFVGAVPPVIGFSSAGGTLLHLNIIAFAAFMFLWQIPHFWMIIIKYGKEYKAAGFETISKYLNETQIRYLVFFWVLFSSVFLFLFCLLFEAVNKNMFVLLFLLNLIFIFFFYRMLFQKEGDKVTTGAFVLINTYGFLIMLAIILVSILKG